MKINVLSMFSGAGIGEVYFKKHGLDVVVASELLSKRADFYSYQHPEVKMIRGDINDKKNFNAMIQASLEKNVNMVLATPPCQGFSSAGLQKKDDPRNKLIITVIECVKILKPDFAIIENVPEFLKTEINVDGKWILIDEYLRENLSGLYNFNKKNIINSMHYGVPQNRQRCVYLLSKKNLDLKWEFPEESSDITTMKDAIGDLPSLDPRITDVDYEELIKIFPKFEEKKRLGASISKWHCPPNHKLRHVIAMMHTPEGQSAFKNEKYYPTLKNGEKSKGFPNTYKRQWWDKPAYTITRYTNRIGSQENGHPGRPIIDSDNEEERIWSDPRVLTVFELIRLTSLPDDWDIPSWATSNFLREIIGESVPPKLLEVAIIELERALNEKQ